MAQQDANTIDMRRFFRAIKQLKWLFAAVILVVVSVACYISYRQLPTVEIKGSMLIGDLEGDNNGKSGALGQMMRTFSVGGGSGTTVDNEVLILQSHDVMVRTVRALGLTRTYVGKNSKGEKAVLYQNTPIKFEAPVEFFDSLQENILFKVKLLGESKADIKIVKGLFKKTVAEYANFTIPGLLKTPYGDFQVIATECYETSPYRDVTVNICNTDVAADKLSGSTKIDVAVKMADVVDIDLRWTNAEQGKAIVDGIMNEYNDKRLDRLHESATAAIQYFDERIAETFKLLQEQEQKVSDYQRENKLMGVDSELELLVGNTMDAKQNVQNESYNIAYYETVLNILRNRLNDDLQIPVMESLNDPNIATFNGYIQARREMRRSATENNEALKHLNEQIEEVAALIIENSEKMIAKAKADVQHQLNLSSTAQSRLDQYPEYQNEYMNLLRDKNYRSSLYEYLVEQRENSVLQLYSSTDAGFIFQPAYVYKTSGLLKKLIWPAVALVFSIVCCLIFAGLWVSFKGRKVCDTMDLSFMHIENNSAIYNHKDPLSINKFRTLITADPQRKLIYFASLGQSEESLRVFTQSLTVVSDSVEVINGFTSNDQLLSPESQAQFNQALDSADYVVVEVPVADRVADLINKVNEEHSALAISIPTGKIKRKTLKSYLKGQRIDKVFTLLMK